MNKKKINLFSLFLMFILLISGCSPKQPPPNDTTPPQVSITNPQNGQTVSGIVTIQAQANDNVAVTKVEFYVDNAKAGEDTSSPYEYEWNTTNYSDGDHTITVKAYDNVGNNSSASITVNVNNTSPSNAWQKTFGGSSNDWALSIQQTSDGGYIVAGWTYSFGAGKNDVYILKLDENGDLVWQKTFGGSDYDVARSIQQTNDGGYIVAGGTNSFGSGGIYILKLDTNGGLIWQKTFVGSSDVYSIQQTSDEGYIVAGSSILKLDSNGNLVWQKTYDGGFHSIQQTSDGGYIVAGYTGSFGAGYYDVYILKLDENGDLVWQKTFGGSDYDGANSVQQTNDGGYIVAGDTMSFGAGYYDVYILKLNPNGDVIWEKTFGGSSNDAALSIQQNSDGGYIVAGYTQSFGAGGNDVYIFKLNANGDLVWQKTFGGSNIDIAYSIQQTNDGGYIIAGVTWSFGAGLSDVYILKLDANGNTGPYPQ